MFFNKKPKFKVILICLLFTFLGSVAFPSEYAREDMVIHLPYAQKINNNNLFTKDYMVNAWHAQKDSSIYYPALSSILKFESLPLEVLIRIFYIPILFFTVLAYYQLASIQESNKWVAPLFVALMLFRFHIGGTAVQLLEAEPLPRAIATLITLWALFFWLRKKLFWASVYVLASFLFHPSAPFLLCAIVLLHRSILWIKSRPRGLIIAVFTIILSPIIIGLLCSSSGSLVSDDWLSIMKERNKFMFIDMWNLKAWLALLVLIVPGFFYLRKYRSKVFSDSLASSLFVSLIASIVFTYIHLILAVAFPVHQVILAQLLRAWWFTAFFSLHALANMLTQGRTSKNAGILFLVIIFCAISYQLLQKVTYGYDQNWVDVQRWVRNNTGVSCIFLTPFEKKGFRVESQRAIIGEYKDGTLGAYTYQFAKEWQDRKKEISDWQLKSDKELLDLREQYYFDMIIAPSHSFYPWKTIYKNEEYQLILMSESRCGT